MLKQIRDIIKTLQEILSELRAVNKKMRLSQPGIVSLRLLLKGNGMAKFVLDLPASETADVLVGGKRELTVVVAGGAPLVFELLGTAVVSEEIDGTQNDSVTGQLVDIDDAGNRSDPSKFDLVLLDNLAPAAPGQVGIRMISE